jgi:hypothetical protein
MVGIGTNYIRKEKLVDVLVTRSSYYDYLSELGSLLEKLEKEIQEYKKTGIDTKNLENLVEQSKIILHNANNSISNDQVNVLVSSISDIESNVNYVHSTLTSLGIRKFTSQYSWLIYLLIISSVLTVYFVPEVLIPLQKIEKEVKKLKKEEKVLVDSRVETEKQYFMRKMDENTFSKIMITKQDNILKIRTTANEKENERKKVLQRAHPAEMLRWFGRGIRNLPKNIKNLFVKAFSKIKIPKVFKKENKK